MSAPHRQPPPARRGLNFSNADEELAASTPVDEVAKVAVPAPRMYDTTPAPRERLPTADSEETTPPFAPPPPREAWAIPVPFAVDEIFEIPASDGEPAEEASEEAHRRLAPIPPALLALPRPVLAAAMSQRASQSAAPPTSLLPATSVANERHGRLARRQWIEQNQLLHQRAALLAKEVFPPASLAEHALAELVAPVLAEAAELHRARSEEAASLAAARGRASTLTHKLHDLVTHVRAGDEYMHVLQEALEGADGELIGLKRQHATSLAHLEQSEGELGSDIDALTKRMEGWATEDAAAAAAPPPALPPAAPSRAATASATVRPSAHSAPAAGRGMAAAHEASARESRMHSEVAAVDGLLLRLGGGTCGWDDKEHAAYMRLRVQCLGTPTSAAGERRGGGGGATPRGGEIHEEDAQGGADDVGHVDENDERIALLLERAARELPGRDYESVREHEAAVTRREAALERRRQVVRAWRARRHADDEQSKLEAEAAAAAAAATRARRGLKQRHSQAASEEGRLQELASYRERKMRQHAERAAGEARQAEARRHREATEHARREQVKEALSARAMQRAAEQAALRSLHERQKREELQATAREKQLAMLTMQQRDAEALERKQHAAAVRVAAAERREERLQQLRENAKPPAARVTVRDAERLTRPTSAASARREETAKRLEQDNKKGPPSRFGSSSLTFAAVGSRMTPGWRKGM